MANGKRNGCINGAKFCKHSTITESARKVAEILNKFPEVTKIANGTICGKDPSQFGIRFLLIHGGWTIKVYGCSAVQSLHIYTNDPACTKEKLELKFPNNIR